MAKNQNGQNKLRQHCKEGKEKLITKTWSCEYGKNEYKNHPRGNNDQN